MRKILAFDVETGGKSPADSDITQLACLYICEGVEVDSINIFMQPRPDRYIYEALTVQGKTEADVLAYPHRHTGYMQFQCWLRKHINRYNPTDKAWPMAFNGTFDMDFINTFFLEFKDEFLGSFINRRLLDPLPLARFLAYNGVEPFTSLTSLSLSSLCTALEIPIHAHDALDDIRATYALWKHISKILHWYQ